MEAASLYKVLFEVLKNFVRQTLFHNPKTPIFLIPLGVKTDDQPTSMERLSSDFLQDRQG